MIRFIMKTIINSNVDGFKAEDFKTLDLEVPELEEMLMAGGRGTLGFEMTEFIGLEIRKSE